ncbi:hypothetical protein ACQEVS_18365 [Streptomyces sp. CA-181903]
MTSYLAIYGNLDVAFAAPDTPARRLRSTDTRERDGTRPDG